MGKITFKCSACGFSIYARPDYLVVGAPHAPCTDAGGVWQIETRDKPKIKRGRRDAQRGKVYKWEDKQLKGVLLKDSPEFTRQLSLDECRELVEQAYERYGRPAPEIKDGRRTRIARGDRFTINLPRWARTVWTVLHEVSHGIAQYYAPEDVAHGRTFARVYFDLLVTFCRLSPATLRASMVAARIKRAEAGACAPPKRTALRELEEARAEYERTRRAFNEAKRRLEAAERGIDAK
jgi:hypothetical protein